jgi:D-alanyl-lipoteichoic acid acyltransferase DltB (MBOAT superfamily)
MTKILYDTTMGQQKSKKLKFSSSLSHLAAFLFISSGFYGFKHKNSNEKLKMFRPSLKLNEKAPQLTHSMEFL